MPAGFARPAVLCALALMQVGCPPPASRCGSDGDCKPVNKCDLTQGICLPRTIECTTNLECLDAHGDEPYRCVDQVCAPLKTADCDTVLAEPADLANDNTVYFGALLPTRGLDESTGLPLRNSIELARRDFRTLSGLPPAVEGGPRRPMAFVVCNDNDDPLGVAHHLVDVVKVPAIVGAAFSGVTLDVANEVTVPNGVLLLSPSATSTLITELSDNDLVWRTSPPDTLQAVAVAGAITELEPIVRTAAGMTASDKVKVAIAHKGDGYGQPLGSAVFDLTIVNQQPLSVQEGFYEKKDYGDGDTATYADTVSAVLALKPHIAVLIGTAEAVTNVFAEIESQWPNDGSPRPYYIFTDGGQLPELIDLVTGNDALRRRVIGTVPGTTSNIFTLFKVNYSSIFSDGTNPQVFGSAGAYDAVYLLAYAAAAVGDRPLTGVNLVEGLKRLVPPATTVSNVGAGQINNAFNALTRTTDGHIDFVGASGPLDFDVATGEAPSDIQIWCVTPVGGGSTLTFFSTGLYYDATNQQMQGTMNCP